MENKKRKNITMIYVITLFVMAAIVIAKYKSESLLASYQIYYRTYLDIAAAGILWLGIPVLITSYLVYLLLQENSLKGMGISIDPDEEQPEDNQRVSNTGSFIKKVLAVMLIMIAGLYCLIVLVVQAFLFESRYEKEEKTGTVLKGTTGSLLDDSEHVIYYKYYNPFIKQKAVDEQFVVEAIMGEKYGDEFTISEWEYDTGLIGRLHGKGTFKSEPEMEVGVSWDVFSHSHSDDRDMRYTCRLIQNYCEENNITRNIVPIYHTENGLLKEIDLFFTLNEIEQCAEDTAGIIGYVLTDRYFNTAGREAALTIICGTEKEEDNFTTLVIQGLLGSSAMEDRFYYTSKENVLAKLNEVCIDLNSAASTGIEEKADEIVTEEEFFQEVSGDFTTLEGAFGQLYNMVFEPKGEVFTPCYNAKGNFYALLGEGEEELSGELRQTRHTVVYDRLSKNGKCQLFVEYKDYMETNGNESYVTTTAILEFYAVEIETGVTVAAGKTSWEEIGSKEYRALTGE